MEMFQEAGAFAYVGFALFCGGLFSVAKGKPVVLHIAAAILAVAMIGDGLGQRLVCEAIERTPDMADKVKFLSLGTREATANLVLGGLWVVLLLAVDAAAKLARRIPGEG